MLEGKLVQIITDRCEGCVHHRGGQITTAPFSCASRRWMELVGPDIIDMSIRTFNLSTACAQK